MALLSLSVLAVILESVPSTAAAHGPALDWFEVFTVSVFTVEFYLLTWYLIGAADMRFLRAIRLLRILKLARYFSALNILLITIRENSKALAASFLILITIMLLVASGMYYFERAAQP